jgi:hypothetical protein
MRLRPKMAVSPLHKRGFFFGGGISGIVHRGLGIGKMDT